MAQKAKFIKDFDYRANLRVEIASKEGDEKLIPEAHYEAPGTAWAIEVRADTKAD
ncbi:hypothetical protein [Microvirga sp. KLBC 81]|uniref:hypothetical protein n=1 Tax=Microvirga sp. KLBC 81 TaxID=1862707 RepID=UPI001402CF25|nr:hypothetical protein [Microvirga sp. KLBC 81]